MSAPPRLGYLAFTLTLLGSLGVGLGASLLLSGCNDDAAPTCGDLECGDHGLCAADACFCRDNYTGPRCDMPPTEDRCSAGTCGLHGSCTEGTCVCSDAFTGARCELAPPGDPCEGIACGLHGSCDEALCVCRDGYSGERCETPPTAGACSLIDCGAHGMCQGGSCFCTDGYSGDRCDSAPTDPCATLDCGAHGACSDGDCVCRDGYSGERCATAPAPCADARCMNQVIYNAPVPDTPVVAYVGGSNWDASFRFDDASRTARYDMLIVGFANYWTPSPGCTGPTEPGLDAMPHLLTNACVQTGPQWLSTPAEWSQCGIQVNCGGEGEGTVGSAVLNYQASGGRVLLSVGGANANSNDMNPAKGTALAHAIWNMYLGGTDARYEGWRPFGEQVVLDGVDLDLEQSPAGCPSSPACTEVQEGWYNFTLTLRALMEADARKQYLITLVPINTKYSESFPGYGAYTYGYLPGVQYCQAIWDPLTSAATAALDAQPERSVYSALYAVDFLWPQFYPSPVEITLNGSCWEDDLLAWTRMAERAPAGQTSRCRVGVGLPFSAGAANGGQIAAADAITAVKGALNRHAVLRARFGGFFGWDEYWDQTENAGAYGAALQSGVSDASFRALID